MEQASMSLDDFKKYTIGIAKGEIKTEGKPKVWLNSDAFIIKNNSPTEEKAFKPPQNT